MRISKELERRAKGKTISIKDALSRNRKVTDAASRYTRNIAQSKRFANDLSNDRGLEVARSRGYSQNTYMGRNEG